MSYKFRELDMSLKGEIDKIKSESGGDSAATSFLSMYMWRSVYGNQIVCQDGFYALKVAGEDNTWFFPTGCEDVKKAFIEYGLSLGGFRLLFATEEDVNFLNKHFAGKMKATEAPDCSEYLYSVDEYKSLEGGRFRPNRKEINRLDANYNLTVSPLTEENAHFVYDIIEAQVADGEKKGCLDTRGDEADVSFLEDIDGNGVMGILVFDADEPVAVMAGMNINDEVFDIAIGDHKAGYNGLLIYCMHQIALAVDEKTRLLNGEEDLGIEGLRMWKNKMHPVELVDIWECKQV